MGTKTANNGSTAFMDEARGSLLLRVARLAISEQFPVHQYTDPELAPLLEDPVFNSKRGSFVTLKINDRLRGCIGSIGASEPLVDGIRENAVGAAFQDSRFPALTPDELDLVTIEVSILTDPVPLEYIDHNDLTAKLRPNVHGLIIRKGMRGATFLPQVWDQLPQHETFLSHLCMKAGLQEDAWKNEKLEIQTYEVQHFEEEQVL